MFNQKSILVIFIDRLGIQIYGGSLPTIVSVQIPSSVVFDMEIISKDSLYSLIKQWVKQFSLTGSQIVFVFSETVYMEKIFSVAEQPQIETEILKFFDMVPYETIWSKVYPDKNGKRAIAISKGFYDGIHQGFLLQGLPTKSIIPAFALGQYEKKKALDVELFSYIIENVDQLSKYSILDAQESNLTPPSNSSFSQQNSTKKKSSLPLLLSVFGFLLLALGIVVYLQYQ